MGNFQGDFRFFGEFFSENVLERSWKFLMVSFLGKG